MKQTIMRGKQYLMLLLVLAILLACNRNTNPLLPEISVSGELRNASNLVVHLSELDVKRIKSIDSVTLDKDGRFSFKIKPTGSMFLLISVKPGQQLALIADPGEKIHLDGDAGKLISSSKISGSPASFLMLEFEKYTMRNQQKADSMGLVFLDSRSDPDFPNIRRHLDSAYQAIANDQRRYMERFIDQHPVSLTSLIVVNRKFGPNAVFAEDKDLKYFLKIDSGLMIAYPGNKHVLDNHIRVEALVASNHKNIVTDSLLNPGMPVPDVKLNNNEGIASPISSLKGKVVLVYFWAAMDAKSRQFIRKLIPVYNLNRKRGFEIYGLALEPNRSLWLNALKLDKPGGLQVNAGSGLNAPEALMFGIKNLPDAILVDRDGKILKRNINLDELREELPKFLK
jgi:hypothetical protein